MCVSLQFFLSNCCRDSLTQRKQAINPVRHQPLGHVAALPYAMRYVSSWQLLISRGSLGWVKLSAPVGGFCSVFPLTMQLVGLHPKRLRFCYVFVGVSLGWYFLVWNCQNTWLKHHFFLGGGVVRNTFFCDVCVVKDSKSLFALTNMFCLKWVFQTSN